MEVGGRCVVQVDDDGVAAEVDGVAAVERLVDVADEVRQEHQAYGRINHWWQCQELSVSTYAMRVVRVACTR